MWSDSVTRTLQIYERHHWLSASTILVVGTVIAFEPRLAFPFIGATAVLMYLRPGTKTMIAIMFAMFPFMYVYTYLQSLQGTALTTDVVPVMYRAMKDVVVILVLARVGADQLLRADAWGRLSWTDVLVGLFLFETVATSVQSLTYGQSILVAILGIRSASLCLVAYFLARVFFVSRPDYGRITRIMFFTGVVVALFGIFQAVALLLGVAATAYGVAGEQSSSFRVFSTMNDPNMYGMYLASCLLLARKDLLRLRRPLRMVGLAVIALGLLLSLSFSVLIPLIALLILYILMRSFRRPRLAFGGLVLLSVTLLFPGVADRLLEIGNLTDASLSLKVIQMQKALDVFLAHPVLGAGYGLVGQSRTWAESEFETDSIAGENYYLILAAQSGIVGLALLVAVLGVWWWERGRIQRAIRDPALRAFIQGVTAIVFVFWMANLVTDHYEGFPNNFVLWFLMGAVIVAGRIGNWPGTSGSLA